VERGIHDCIPVYVAICFLWAQWTWEIHIAISLFFTVSGFILLLFVIVPVEWWHMLVEIFGGNR